MSAVGTKNSFENPAPIKPGPGALAAYLAEHGRFPPLSLVSRSLAKSAASNPSLGVGKQLSQATANITNFLSYQFSSSILVPVDSFSFAWSAPDSDPLSSVVRDGDIVQLVAADQTICTGIIDQTEIETDADGEKATVNGRDLISQLEDQDAVTLEDKKIWLNTTTVEGVIKSLIQNTRIQRYDVSTATTRSNLFFATEPNESKLSALQRFLEGINCVCFTRADGTLVVGKPNMAQEARGTLYVSRADRASNVLSIRSTRGSTRIPNRISVIWTAQENVKDKATIPQQQIKANTAKRPNDLYKLGHFVFRSVTISIPTGADASTGDSLNQLVSESGNMLADYANREFARANIDELIVQVVVKGHYDDSGRPFVVDTCWDIFYDRDNVSEKMYLYQVDYNLTGEDGQITNLFFCRLGTIVANNRASAP